MAVSPALVRAARSTRIEGKFAQLVALPCRRDFFVQPRPVALVIRFVSPALQLEHSILVPAVDARCEQLPGEREEDEEL